MKDGSSSEGKEVLIDGQQRITALTAALLGQEIIDSNYKKKRIKIAFNVKNESFETLNPAIEKQPEYIPDIAEFMKDNQFNIYNFATQYATQFNLEPNVISERIYRLMSIRDVSIGRIELGSSLSIDEVTNIFVRINSEGMVLSQADFAMSKISVNEKYYGNDIRKTIDYFCHLAKTPADFDNIKNNDIDFSNKEIFKKIIWIKDKSDLIYLPDYTDVLRVSFTYKFKRGKLQDLVSLLSGRDFETREYKEDIIRESFETLYDGVKSFINETNFERYTMILKSAGIIDSILVRSQNVYNFGYILYLLLREKNISNDLIEQLVRKWIVMSIVTQRYTSSPESAFDLDIRRFNENDDIVEYINEELARQLSDNFWNNILVEKINTSVASSPYWKTYVMAQIKLRDKGFLGSAIEVRSLIEERGDVHHIFPKNYLQKNNMNSRQIYNQIANFAMIQSEVNILISDKAPNVYMHEVLDECNGISKGYPIKNKEELYANLKENCIPNGFEYMTKDNYQDFLKQRRILMAHKIKEYYESL